MPSGSAKKINNNMLRFLLLYLTKTKTNIELSINKKMISII